MCYIISEEEFREYIPKDVEEALYNCISNAVTEHQEKYKTLNYRHSPRTNASIIHDLIIDNVRRSFQGRSNARYFTKKNCFQLVISDKDINERVSVIRFKKLNQKKIASKNVPHQTMAGYEQISLLGPSINLNAGYLLHGLDVSFFVTRPYDSKNNEWEFQLLVKQAAKPADVVYLPQNESGLPERKPKTKGTELEENAVKE
jgi:hypothetical protein